MVAGLSTPSFDVCAHVLQNKDLRLIKSTRFSEKYVYFFFYREGVLILTELIYWKFVCFKIKR